MSLLVHDFGIIRVAKIRPFNNDINLEMHLTTGSGIKESWPSAVTSTGHITCHEIDGVTNVTMGANLGETGIKLDVKAPNGAGTSYIIDGQTDGAPIFQVLSTGIINMVNGPSIDPHIGTGNVLTIFGGDATDDDIVLRANSVDSYAKVRISGDSGVILYATATESIQFHEEANMFFDFNRIYTLYEPMTASGAAFTIRWNGAVTTTGNIIAVDIDGVTNLTMGTDFGETGVKIDVKAPDGTGTSYIIDGQTDGAPTFQLLSTGVINMVNGVKIDPHIGTAAQCWIYGGDTAADHMVLQANSNQTYARIKIFGSGGGATSIAFYSAASDYFDFWELNTQRYFRIRRQGAIYATSATASVGFQLNMNSVTTSDGIQLLAKGITEGNGLAIYVDSDVVTTGKAINIYSGPTSAQSVFSVDEEGSITGNKSDGTSRWVHEHIKSATAVKNAGQAADWISPDANRVGGWRLDNALELLEFTTHIEPDWDGASDPYLDVVFEVNINNGGGLVTDTVDLQLVVRLKGDAETAPRTQTIEVATTVGQSPQFKQFTARIPIDYNHGTDPVQPGDSVGLVVNLETDTSEVDDIVVNVLEFKYNTKKPRLEA